MPGRRLPRSTPEERGIDPGALVRLVDALVATPELHSLMVLRHGHVVAEGWAHPYAPERRHQLFSLSKSFTATAVGLAVADGLVSLDDRVVDLLADHAPPDPSEHLREVRVRHLLTMTLGHEVSSGEVFMGRDWQRAILALPVPLPPGSRFVYNTAATYLLAAIVQRVTGERLLTYLRPRVLRPLGIASATWQRSPDGVDAGGFGLSLTTEDIAAFGQLYLDDGVWRGRRLLPEGWVAEATAAQVSTAHSPWSPDTKRGYGYQFWRCPGDAYRADGSFGQFCVVVPSQRLVVATTAASTDMQGMLTALWERLLPGLHDGPLPDAPDARAALTERLDGLRLDPPRGQAVTDTARGLSGRTITFPERPHGISTAVLEVGEDADRLTVRAGRRTRLLRAGHGEPLEQRVMLPAPPFRPTTALVSGTWTDTSTYVLTCRYLEGPYVATVELQVAGDAVVVAPSLNVSLGPTTVPPLHGVLEPPSSAG